MYNRSRSKARINKDKNVSLSHLKYRPMGAEKEEAMKFSMRRGGTAARGGGDSMEESPHHAHLK